MTLEPSYLNLMDQYRPCYKASEYPELNRRITYEEYVRAVGWAKELGLTRLDERAAFSRRWIF